MYLEPTDYGYERHHIQVPVIPEGGYIGKIDAEGSPVDQADYDNWIASLPKVWQNNPFHNHFIHCEPDVTDGEIQAQMAFHLPNFYVAWCAGKTIRSGWDVKTRIRPKHYDKIDPQNYDLRKTQCLTRVEGVKSILTQIKTDEKGKTFPATDIDIGPEAIWRITTVADDYTYVQMENPANDTGVIDTFEVYARFSLVGFKVGTFYGTAPDFTPRDFEEIGDVTGGSKQTFTGKDCDVVTGDYIGAFFSDGAVRASGTGTQYYKANDQFGAGQQEYTSESYTSSYKGTGETAGWAGGDVNGVAIADIAKINGIALADIAKVNGVA